jgi:hypothetical protein
MIGGINLKMAKQIIIYNLAPHVTDEQYREYVVKDKGPLLESLPSVKDFEMVKVTSKAITTYIGIVHLRSLEEFQQKDMSSTKFQEFLKKWQPMVTNVQIYFGDEIY